VGCGGHLVEVCSILIEFYQLEIPHSTGNFTGAGNFTIINLFLALKHLSILTELTLSMADALRDNIHDHLDLMRIKSDSSSRHGHHLNKIFITKSLWVTTYSVAKGDPQKFTFIFSATIKSLMRKRTSILVSHNNINTWSSNKWLTKHTPKCLQSKTTVSRKRFAQCVMVSTGVLFVSDKEHDE